MPEPSGGASWYSSSSPRLPYYFSINNFMYPVMSILAVPFLYITAKYLLKGDGRMVRLTTAAAVAFLIYAPFEYIQPLGDWLISVVVGQVVFLLGVLNHPAFLSRHGTSSCGAVSGRDHPCLHRHPEHRDHARDHGRCQDHDPAENPRVLLVAPTIYILNLFRNAFVIIAYTDQWFPYFPEIAGNGEFGYESFFWAHHVIAEMLALVVLVLIAYGLFRIIPALGKYAESLYDLYSGEVRKVFGTGTGSAGQPKG
jgi:exosortase/archaeosortase family protein